MAFVVVGGSGSRAWVGWWGGGGGGGGGGKSLDMSENAITLQAREM